MAKKTNKPDNQKALTEVDVAGNVTSDNAFAGAAAPDDVYIDEAAEVPATTSVANMIERIEELEEENDVLSDANDALMRRNAYLQGVIEGMKVSKGIKTPDDTHVGSIDDLGTIDDLNK